MPRKREHALVPRWHRKIRVSRRRRKVGTGGTLGIRTKILICLATGLLTFDQPARAAGNLTTAPSHTASFESRHHARQIHKPAIVSQPGVSGVIPRAIRGGNPLQMLNPFAPAKYGTAEENVSFDPDLSGKANGINFFSVSF
jgi:hypothetical protein